jgi:hypothetical protein
MPLIFLAHFSRLKEILSNIQPGPNPSKFWIILQSENFFFSQLSFGSKVMEVDSNQVGLSKENAFSIYISKYR